MNPSIQFKKATSLFVVPFVLACFAFLPRAQAVSPPPDGGYPNFNTAEGDKALFSLTTGRGNTALGANALLSLTSGSENTATGTAALKNNTADQNTADGYQALINNTTGPFNTATGWRALFNNTTGDRNTAFGSRAMLANTTGFENTAVGRTAMFRNTEGGDNVAVGIDAVQDNTTGNNNTGIGSFALLANTIGNDNTATGFAALGGNAPAAGTGDDNTAVGSQALNSNTSGGNNAAVGSQALASNTTGGENCGFGFQALFSNTVGGRNVAVGSGALNSLTSGDSNTAVGSSTLSISESLNFNTALGRRSLSRTQGDQNTGLGFFAGSNLSDGGTNNIYMGNVGPVPIGTESNTIRIGTQTATVATVGNPPVESHPMPAHTATYIAGISGTAVVGDPVVVDANGHLGTATSSARFKKDIKPMDKTSETILALTPVSFQYKNDSKGAPQFGLIAEEVAKVNPDLVVRDRKGEIYSVRYEAVNAMLLNEFLKEHRKVEELKKDFQATVAQQQKEIQALTARLEEQAAQIQNVSAQLELSKPAPQTVLNNP